MRRNEIEKLCMVASSHYDCMNAEMARREVDGNICLSFDMSKCCYLQISEISKLWELKEKPLWTMFSEALVTLHSMSLPVSFLFRSDGKKICVYLGTLTKYVEFIKDTFLGVLPQMKFLMEKDEYTGKEKEKPFEGKVLFSKTWSDGGFLLGNPTGTEDFTISGQLERVIHGMGANPWEVCVFASPVSKENTINRYRDWTEIATANSIFSEVSYTDGEAIESTSFKKSYMHSAHYYEKIMEFCDKMKECVAVGEWDVVVNFASTSYQHARLLGGLLSSAYFGEESVPVPVHAVMHKSGQYKMLIDSRSYTHKFYGEIDYPTYGSRLSSYETAIYMTPPVVDTAGITIKDHVEFDVNRDVQGDTSLGRILENGDVTNNHYRINLDELNRHCLIIGLTGSGKTNTIKSLIHSAANSGGQKRPFMIIEPAKKEYWELYKLGFDKLRIYSVGSNEPFSSRLCINPFERVVYVDEQGNRKSVSIQTHIDFVFAAFKASFIMYTPMPYILEKAIYSIYEDCGWDISNNVNTRGAEIYPTIEDLYFKIPEIIEEMGYDTRMSHDLNGSLQARINSLRIGSKGATLNVQKSFPMKHLLEGNTIVELEDIGDDDVRSFIISLLLMRILEYRRQQEDCHHQVRHVLFFEEAHRLLKNIQSSTGENADPRGAAVEFFCNLLAELRSKGQGFVVADQIPSKLAPDLIKNTNLKIVHRTVSEEERKLMGGATNMTELQTEALSTLKQGVAAMYSEGDYRPKLVKPHYAGALVPDHLRNLSREEVLRRTSVSCMNINGDPGYIMLTDKRCAICRACKGCIGLTPEDVLTTEIQRTNFIRLARVLNPDTVKTCVVDNLDRHVLNFIKDNNVAAPENRVVRSCLMAALLRIWNLNSQELREKIERIYIREKI